MLRDAFYDQGKSKSYSEQASKIAGIIILQIILA